MKNVSVRMKDGRTFCGPVWNRNFVKGFVEIPSETDEKLYFKDMKHAIVRGERTTVETIGDINYIEHSRVLSRERGIDPDTDWEEA